MSTVYDLNMFNGDCFTPTQTYHIAYCVRFEHILLVDASLIYIHIDVFSLLCTVWTCLMATASHLCTQTYHIAYCVRFEHVWRLLHIYIHKHTTLPIVYGLNMFNGDCFTSIHKQTTLPIVYGLNMFNGDCFTSIHKQTTLPIVYGLNMFSGDSFTSIYTNLSHYLLCTVRTPPKGCRGFLQSFFFFFFLVLKRQTETVNGTSIS